MTQIQVIQRLNAWGKKGIYVFTKHELAKLFPDDSPKTFTERLNRLIKAGILKRACRGIYVNEEMLPRDGYTLERVARSLRRGEYNYVSLESMLSEYGVISQIPIDRVTVMTTGRKGEYKTIYGVVEFTHTKRSRIDIIDNTRVIEHRPLRIATKQAAWRDLKRVGRNTHLVITTEIDNGEDH